MAHGERPNLGPFDRGRRLAARHSTLAYGLEVRAGAAHAEWREASHPAPHLVQHAQLRPGQLVAGQVAQLVGAEYEGGGRHPWSAGDTLELDHPHPRVGVPRAAAVDLAPQLTVVGHRMPVRALVAADPLGSRI